MLKAKYLRLAFDILKIKHPWQASDILKARGEKALFFYSCIITIHTVKRPFALSRYILAIARSLLLHSHTES